MCLLIFATAVTGAVAGIAGGAAGSPLPPAAGDWVVDANTSVSGQALVVNGSLIVTNSSMLSLDQVSLRFNVPGGISWINVSADAAVVMSGSTIDRVDGATTLGGRVQGSLVLSNMTLANVSATHANGSAGVIIDGGWASLDGVTLTACSVAFSLHSGTLYANDSVVDGCSRAMAIGTDNASGQITVGVARTLFARTGEVLQFACAACAPDVNFWLEDVRFTNALKPSGALFNVTGSGPYGNLSTTFRRVNVSAVNFSLQLLWQVDAQSVSTTVLESRLEGTAASLAAFYLRAVRTSLALAIDGSVARSSMAVYVFMYADARSSNATSDFAFRNSTLGSATLVQQSGSASALRAEDCRLFALVALLPPASGNSVDVLRTTFAPDPLLFSYPGVMVGTFGASPVRVSVDRSRFEGSVAAILLTAAADLDLRNSVFTDLQYGVNASGRTNLTVSNCSFANVSGGAFSIRNLLPGTVTINGSDIRLSNIVATGTAGILHVEVPISPIQGLAINVAMENVSITGGHASLLNYSGPGADAFWIANSSARGDGGRPGVWIRYSQRLNLTASNVVLENHTQAFRVERSVASFAVDTWALTDIVVSGSVFGIELRTAHLIDAQFAVRDCRVAASQAAFLGAAVRGNITGGSLTGPGAAVEVHDGQVTVTNTTHNLQMISTDFRLGTGYVEAFGNYSFDVRWTRTGTPPVGFRFLATAATGEELVNETLDALGQPFAGLRHGRLYYFTQNLSNFDARRLDISLLFPGRPPATRYLELGANNTPALVLVDDLQAPAVAVVGDQPPDGLFLNSSALPLEFSLFDPETGVDWVEVNVSGVGATMRLGFGGKGLLNFSVPLGLSAEATYLVTITAVDVNGSTRVERIYVTLDSVAPNPVVLAYPPGAAFSMTHISLELASDPDTVTLAMDGVLATKGANFNVDRPWNADPILAEGWHNLTIVAVDRAGNRAIVTFPLEVDLTPPDPQVQGISNGLQVSAGPLHVIVGTSATDTVVFDGTVIQGASGIFGVDVPLALGESTHTLRVTDRAGNSVLLTYAVTLDTFAPQPQLLPPFAAGGVYRRNVTGVEVQVQGTLDTVLITLANFSQAPQTNGRAIFQLTLPEGQHRLTIAAVDAAGNRGTAELTIIVDLTPPEVVSTSPANGSSVRRPGPILSVHVSEAARVALGNVIVDTINEVANFTLSPVSGPFDVGLVVTDLAGNAREVLLRFVGDFVPPALVVRSPPNGSEVPSPTVRIEGTVEIGARLTLDGIALAVSADGAFGVEVPLDRGANQFTLIATDDAGNTETLVLSLTRGPVGGAFPLLLAGVGAVLALGVAVVAIRARRRRP